MCSRAHFTVSQGQSARIHTPCVQTSEKNEMNIFLGKGNSFFCHVAHPEKKLRKLNVLPVSLGIFGITSTASCPGMVCRSWTMDESERRSTIFERMFFIAGRFTGVTFCPNTRKSLPMNAAMTATSSHACLKRLRPMVCSNDGVAGERAVLLLTLAYFAYDSGFDHLSRIPPPGYSGQNRWPESSFICAPPIRGRRGPNPEYPP